MNLDDYEQKFLPIYQSFAEAVRFILEKAILAAETLPRPQSIQCRAKGMESLRRRLTEMDKLDTQILEDDRRDLAGVRLIFYTNNDVNLFLASPLIHENFQVEGDSIKIHGPSQGNKGAQYRAHHYTVQLGEDRRRLPEYAKFQGLRCEIQVQTILNHAWAETSHDILYKNKLGGGYGSKAIKGITRRFERIMERYLIPAGFEIQRAQQEYVRILQGKDLFDQNIANLLDNAQNNNRRYEILSGLKDYAIPNYDDLTAAYEGLQGPLLKAVKAARITEPVPIETTYGNMAGHRADAITKLVVEITRYLRYIDVIGTLELLIDIYREERNDDIQRQILNVTRELAEYNIDAYNRVGTIIQMALVDRLADMSDIELESISPIALTVWAEAIKPDISGTKWKADSVVLSKGAVPASDQLREIRDKALGALFAAYDRAIDDEQRGAVLLALAAATKVPNQAEYSNELQAITLKDATRIVEFMMKRAEATSYEILQYMEQRFFRDYVRTKKLIIDPENLFGCQLEAEALVSAIVKFRKRINADDRFVRYKILVGFNSVYPDHWTDEKFDYRGSDVYRRSEASRYIDEIDEANESDWFDLIARCAETKSDDRATFPVFGDFIRRLAERKPEVADRVLIKASDNLRNFLPGFLNGLAISGRSDIYERILEIELESAKNLAGIAKHFRYADVKNPKYITRLLRRAINTGDKIAVIECLVLGVEHSGTDRISDFDTFLGDALAFLNGQKDPRWVSEVWFLEKAPKFFEELNPERTAQVLQNLEYVREVDHQIERVLILLAERQPAAIWEYFWTRLATESEDVHEEESFQAVPFHFDGLEKVLSKDLQLAISKGLTWFAQNPELFKLRGGRLLSNAFPHCTADFASALFDLVKVGGDKEAEFSLAILQNYRGETSFHVVLKEIVSRFTNDADKMSGVRSCIDSIGIVCGEFGLAESWQVKKDSLTEWLADERPSVKSFAEEHIARLDLRIALERESAEARKEMRIRSYDEYGEASGDDLGHEGDR